MTAEEKGAWQQARSVAYALLQSVEAHEVLVASQLLNDLELLLKHLQQIEARQHRGEDNG